MLPLTLLAAQKLSDLLTNANALQIELSSLATASNVTFPNVLPTQVVLSSASPDMGDRDVQLSYPRVCIYTGALKNTRTEKFQSISGSLAVIAEVWASANLATDVDQWIHFYVEGLTSILCTSAGDWGDGIYFSGQYDVQIQSPKSGGLGYVQSAKVTCVLNVSRS